jgi:hypothetical protein
MQGVKPDILEAVDAISKRNGETKDDYLDRVASNLIATEVKFCDMLHNSDYTRLAGVFTDEDAKNIGNRYVERMKILIGKTRDISKIPQFVLEAVNAKINAYEGI